LVVAAWGAAAARTHLRASDSGAAETDTETGTVVDANGEANGEAVAMSGEGSRVVVTAEVVGGTLSDWLKAEFEGALTKAQLHKINLVLDSQNIRSFKDLASLGTNGIAAIRGLTPVIRQKLYDAMIRYVGETTKTNDGLLVPTPYSRLTKDLPPKKCYRPDPSVEFFKNLHRDAPSLQRFRAVLSASAQQSARWNEVGDWLRRSFPKISSSKLKRTVFYLEHYSPSIRSFETLSKVGEGAIARMHVPSGVREKLRDAIIFYVGLKGYDDGSMETYREVKKPVKKDNRVEAIAVPHKPTACERERERKSDV